MQDGTKRVVIQEMKVDSIHSVENSGSVNSNVTHSEGEDSGSNSPRRQCEQATSESSIDASSILKVRTLTELYESCSFALAVTDPILFEVLEKNAVWRQAMQEEIKSIEKNETWALCELPAEKKQIGVKWVFKTKYKPNGEIQKHKARLLAKGYTQEYGVDYEDIFSPIARMEVIILLLSVAAQKNRVIFSLMWNQLFWMENWGVCGATQRIWNCR